MQFVCGFQVVQACSCDISFARLPYVSTVNIGYFIFAVLIFFSLKNKRKDEKCSTPCLARYRMSLGSVKGYLKSDIKFDPFCMPPIPTFLPNLIGEESHRPDPDGARVLLCVQSSMSIHLMVFISPIKCH